MSEARRLDLLALFPSFESPVFGGIQASGREAWRSIAVQTAVSADAFCYEPGRSRMATAFDALRRRVSANTVLVWHCGLLRLVPLIAGLNGRLVLFLHGIEAWKKQDYLTTRLLRRTDLFLTNSDHTWRRFAAIHPYCADARHRTVHLGSGQKLAAIQDPADGPPSALMIGRLSRAEDYKGHREAIQLWPGVLARLPEAELWIVGDGDLRPELQQMTSALGLSRHVRFFGAVPHEEKEVLLQKCRTFILPSTGEGFGLVYLEAMRMGRPCLVSTLDAGMEVVNPPEAGLAVRLSNTAQTAEAVIRLLSAGEDWDRLSAQARRRYETCFTAQHFEQRLIAALFDA